MLEGKSTVSALRQRAREARMARRLRRLLPPVMGLVVALLVVVYVSSLLFSQYGSFTISVKGYQDRALALAISENDSFLKSGSRLTATELKEINNITYTGLPSDLNDTNGSHNGEDYLAYTFYVKNTGERECSYQYSLQISRATVGIDAAIRVRIYLNPYYYRAETGEYNLSGAYVDYAKPRTGGNGLPEVDPGERVMTNFVSHTVVAEDQISGFGVGDISKITVVIWLEGEDPDCTDDVLGGQFQVDMDLEIVGA